MLYDALVDRRGAGARAVGATDLRRQARRPPAGHSGVHHPAADSRRAAGTPGRAAEGRRPVRVRPRRRGGARADSGGSSVRGRARASARAIAAPALAGIPVTHRGMASGFVVVSGHAEEAYRPMLESLAPTVATVVVLMGLGTSSDRAAAARARLEPVDAAGGPARCVDADAVTCVTTLAESTRRSGGDATGASSRRDGRRRRTSVKLSGGARRSGSR